MPRYGILGHHEPPDGKMIMFHFSTILWTALAGMLLVAEPGFDIATTKKDDLVTLGKDGKTFTARVASGIGGATIELTSGEWPKEVTLRFEYAGGKAFNSLEGFFLTTEKFKIEGSLRESGKMAYFEKGDDGKFAPKGTVNAVAKQNKDGIEVTLPSGQLAGVKKVEIRWIDFYR